MRQGDSATSEPNTLALPPSLQMRQAEFDEMAAALRGDGVKITKFSHNRNPLSAKISIHTSNHTFKLVDDDTRIVWLGGGMFSKGKKGELVADICGMKRGLHEDLETDKMTRDTEVAESSRHFSIVFSDGKFVVSWGGGLVVVGRWGGVGGGLGWGGGVVVVVSWW